MNRCEKGNICLCIANVFWKGYLLKLRRAKTDPWVIAQLELRWMHRLLTIEAGGSRPSRHKPEDGFRFGWVVETALQPGSGLWKLQGCLEPKCRTQKNVAPFTRINHADFVVFCCVAIIDELLGDYFPTFTVVAMWCWSTYWWFTAYRRITVVICKVDTCLKYKPTSGTNQMWRSIYWWFTVDLKDP